MKLNNYDISIVDGYFILQEMAISGKTGKAYLTNKETYAEKEYFINILLEKGETLSEVISTIDTIYTEYQQAESVSYLNEKARKEREKIKRKENKG